MVTLIIFMYILSAALPIWGLFSLYVSAKRLAAANTNLESIRLGDITNVLKGASRAVAERPKRALIDICLIGGGLMIGTVASVTSLFI